MPRGRDEAGNIWELDSQGQPLRLVQSAQASAPASMPGALGVVPPNPAMVAAKAREQQRQDAQDARAAATDRRTQLDWNASHNPDGSPKVQAPSLLGNPNLQGPDYLKTLPQNIRNRVQQLLDGRSMLTAREKGTPLGQQLMDAANQADPTFDENASAARHTERLQYTGQGKGAQLVQAANRFARHLGDLYEASRALGGPDLGWSPLSNLATATTNSFRQGKAATYNMILPLIQGEVQKLTKNGAATEGEAQHIMGSLSPNQPEDVRYAAMKELARLGRAQIDPLHQSWESAWQGSTAPPIPMDVDPVANAVFDAVDQGTAPPERDRRGEFMAPGTPANGGNAPPMIGGGPGGGNSPGGPGGGPPKIGGADYSQMTGGPSSEVAQGGTRNEYDPVTSAGIDALIRKGRPVNEAQAYAQSHGFDAPDPATYAAAVAYHKAHPEYKGSFAEANKTVPVSGWSQFAASPAGAFGAGMGDAATLGLNDEIVGAGNAIIGGDYAQGRDAFNANKNILAETHAGANLAGNVAGGFATGGLGAPALARIPGALAVQQALGKFAPLAGDAAYGAAYGAGENNDNRLLGGVTGLVAGGAGGAAGRGATRGLANVIAPPAGRFGPAYAQGVFPTIGQRFGQSGAVGRAVNTAEQAMQSMPGLGSLVTRARDIPRDAAQVGAFNQGLADLAPFQAAGHDIPNALPAGMQPGTGPHAFTHDAFGRAYDIARRGMQFAPDAQYIAEHRAFNDTLNSGVLDANQSGQVQRVINTSVGSRLPRGGGVMNGEAYQQASSDMGRAIDTWSRNPNTQPMANALSEYQGVFDAAARRNSNPEAVNLLDAADRGYAKYARVRNAGARVGGEPGTFTMKNLERAVQQEGGGVASGPFQRGQALMQDYSTAIQPLGDTLSNSGTGERLLTNKVLLGSQGGVGAAGLGTGLGGALLAHPGALAPFAAYAPGVNHAITRAIAPREFTLPPEIAQLLETGALNIRNRAPLAGRLAVPAALGWELNQ